MSQPQWNQLAEGLARDAATTVNLAELLREERQLLGSRDYARYPQLLQDKQALLQSLEQGLLARRQWLTQAGFSDERAALDAATEQAPETASQWRQLAQQWQACQEYNRGNEQIAQRTRLVVGRVLDLLRGGSAPALYDASGRARNHGPGQRLGDA